MKGVSEFVVVLIILIIVIASISVLWLFYNSMFGSVVTQGETSSLGETLSSCMKIDSANGNKIYLRNCGTGTVSNNSISVYMDDAPFAFTMNPSSIGEGQVAEIALSGLWGISLGNHKVRISNKAGEVERYVKAELPDSCVLALDFDEGSGTTVNDKSGYGNNGILYNSPNVTWNYDCKFGGCLAFNSTGTSTAGRVEIPNSQSLNATGNQITVAAWVRPYNFTPGSPYGTIVWKPNTWGFGVGGGSGATNPLIQFYLVNSTGDQLLNWSTNSINFNVWSHLTLVYNGSYASIFINGNLDKNVSITGNISANTKNVFIGQRTDLDRAFNGTIGTVRIYNKVLTPSQTVSLSLGELT